jgi:hypothetical protein
MTEVIDQEQLLAQARKAQEELQAYIQFVAYLQSEEERMLTNVSFILSQLIEVIQNG